VLLHIYVCWLKVWHSAANLDQKSWHLWSWNHVISWCLQTLGYPLYMGQMSGAEEWCCGSWWPMCARPCWFLWGRWLKVWHSAACGGNARLWRQMFWLNFNQSQRMVEPPLPKKFFVTTSQEGCIDG
jgi:hypothetical protein